MGKITLDADTFRALASSTRLTVLKSLDERRKTLTELSRDLALNKATVHEHMALLTAAGLVRKRDDEGRKWIYYELTWTGQRILHPEATTTFNLLLALSVAAAGGGVAMLGRAMGWWLQDTVASRQSDGADAAPGQGVDQLAISAEEDSAMASSDANSSTDASAPPSSGGDPSSAPSSSTAAGEPAPASPEAYQDSAGGENELRLVETDDAAGDGGSGPLFFDDGGWFAIALLVTCALFLGLAFILQRKFVTRPFDESSAASAEQGAAAPGPGGPPSPPNPPGSP